MVSVSRYAASGRAVWQGHGGDGKQASAFQSTRSLELARYALQSVSLYRDVWGAAGVTAGDLRTMEDFRRLPIVTKEQLQDAGAGVVADGVDLRRLRGHETSGSSGQPLVIRRTRLEDQLLQAIRVRRMMKMYGLRLRDRRVGIRYGGDAMWSPGLYSRIGLLRQQSIECRRPTEQIVEAVIRANPNVLGGYPCSLADIADAVGNTLGSLRYVIAAGDTLSAPTRRRIEAGFGVPVYDSYAAHECNLLAQQCTWGVFHIAEESALIEILRADGMPAAVGEQGEAVITALHSFAAPIIRYRLGDLLVPGEPCECGAGGRTIQHLVGRVQEMFERPDGSTYHPFLVTVPLDAVGGRKIRTYRVTQLSATRIEVLIEPRSEFSNELLRATREAMLKAFDYPVELDVQLTQGLLAKESGKFEAFRRGPDFQANR